MVPYSYLDSRVRRGWQSRGTWVLPALVLCGMVHRVNGVKKAAALRKYFSEDPKLQELISVFSQRFSAMGTKKSYTMSTLADLTWTVACEVGEAMNEGRIPGVARAVDVRGRGVVGWRYRLRGGRYQPPPPPLPKSFFRRDFP